MIEEIKDIINMIEEMKLTELTNVFGYGATKEQGYNEGLDDVIKKIKVKYNE